MYTVVGALCEGITGEVGRASADGIVVLHRALSSNAAGVLTWICALVPHASHVGATLGGHHALWSTVGRYTHEIR